MESRHLGLYALLRSRTLPWTLLTLVALYPLVHNNTVFLNFILQLAAPMVASFILLRTIFVLLRIIALMYRGDTFKDLQLSPNGRWILTVFCMAMTGICLYLGTILFFALNDSIYITDLLPWSWLPAFSYRQEEILEMVLRLGFAVVLSSAPGLGLKFFLWVGRSLYGQPSVQMPPWNIRLGGRGGTVG